MDSRERTLLALSHREPDRIPVDFWASAGFRARMESELGLSFAEFLDEWDVDLRYIDGPRYVGPPLTGTDYALSVDIWGVPRKLVTLDVGGHREHYKEVVAEPLATAESIDDVAAYAGWPSADLFDYGGVEAQCDRIRDAGRAVVFMGDRLNRIAQLKPAMYLRGTDRIFLDMALRPDLARAILGRIRSFYKDYLARILDAARGKIDVVLMGDDFGSQTGLLMSPGMWDDFLRQGFVDYVRLIKQHGGVAMHHTCGAVADLVPRLVQCGLDVLQSLQPEANGMDLAALKTEFGDVLSFHGGVSIQRTLPHGTPHDVRREVRELARAMGEGGGYIFCTAHSIQADTPMANVLALMASYREYGRYE